MRAVDLDVSVQFYDGSATGLTGYSVGSWKWTSRERPGRHLLEWVWASGVQSTWGMNPLIDFIYTTKTASFFTSVIMPKIKQLSIEAWRCKMKTRVWRTSLAILWEGFLAYHPTYKPKLLWLKAVNRNSVRRGTRTSRQGATIISRYRNCCCPTSLRDWGHGKELIEETRHWSPRTSIMLDTGNRMPLVSHERMTRTSIHYWIGTIRVAEACRDLARMELPHFNGRINAPNLRNLATIPAYMGHEDLSSKTPGNNGYKCVYNSGLYYVCFLRREIFFKIFPFLHKTKYWRTDSLGQS